MPGNVLLQEVPCATNSLIATIIDVTMYSPVLIHKLIVRKRNSLCATATSHKDRIRRKLGLLHKAIHKNLPPRQTSRQNVGAVAVSPVETTDNKTSDPIIDLRLQRSPFLENSPKRGANPYSFPKQGLNLKFLRHCRDFLPIISARYKAFFYSFRYLFFITLFTTRTVLTNLPVEVLTSTFQTWLLLPACSMVATARTVSPS